MPLTVGGQGFHQEENMSSHRKGSTAEQNSSNNTMKKRQELNDKIFQNTRKSWTEVRDELRKGGSLTSMSVKLAVAQMAKEQKEADEQQQQQEQQPNNASTSSIDPKDLLNDKNNTHESSHHLSINKSSSHDQNNSNNSTSSITNSTTPTIPSSIRSRKLRRHRNSQSLSDIVQSVSHAIRKNEIIDAGEEEQLGNRLWKSNSNFNFDDSKSQCIYTGIKNEDFSSSSNDDKSNASKSQLMLSLKNELQTSSNRNINSGITNNINTSLKKTDDEDGTGRSSLAGILLLKKPQIGLPGRSASAGSILGASRRIGGGAIRSTINRPGRPCLDSSLFSVTLHEDKSTSHDNTTISSAAKNILPQVRDLLGREGASLSTVIGDTRNNDDDDQSIDIFGEHDPSFHEDVNDDEESNDDLLETWNHELVSHRRSSYKANIEG